MAFQARGPEDHPLGWGDEQLRYMIARRVNPTIMYRLMHYDGKRPSLAFMERLKRLGWTKDL